MSWNNANNAILAEGKRVLIHDPDRFNVVSIIDVDEHAWRHTRHGDKCITPATRRVLENLGLGGNSRPVHRSCRKFPSTVQR